VRESSLRSVTEERDALRLLNATLAQRLRDAVREREEIKVSVSTSLEKGWSSSPSPPAFVREKETLLTVSGG
jgi:hypothetical protein